MRKGFYALSAIAVGAFLLVTGVALAPAPVFAGCCVSTVTISGAKTTTPNYCDATTACTPSTSDLSTVTCDTANATCVAPAAPASTPGAAASGTQTQSGSGGKCDTSNYKPNVDHGLLNGITAQCAACGQCSIADIFTVGNTIIMLLLGLSGSVMLLMMIYAGFILLTSSGNASQVDKAKKVLVGAIIGIVIVFIAYVAVEFLLEALGVPNAANVLALPFQTAAKK